MSNLRFETNKTVVVKTKKERTIRTTLNVIGIFLFSGYLLLSFTVPYGLDEHYNIRVNEHAVLSVSKWKEFLAFLFVVSSIYFVLVNLIKKRKLLIMSLAILFVIDVVIFLVLFLSH